MTNRDEHSSANVVTCLFSRLGFVSVIVWLGFVFPRGTTAHCYLGRPVTGKAQHVVKHATKMLMLIWVVMASLQ